MSTSEILEWLESASEALEKEGMRDAAIVLAVAIARLRAEIERRNAESIAALLKKPINEGRK